MTMLRSPSRIDLEEKGALLCVTFDGMVLRFKPDSHAFIHDLSLLCGECRNVRNVVTTAGRDGDARIIVPGYSSNSSFFVRRIGLDIYLIGGNRNICAHKQIGKE